MQSDAMKINTILVALCLRYVAVFIMVSKWLSFCESRHDGDIVPWRSVKYGYPGGKSGLTDMVCYKKLLYMVGFLRPPATTSGWTTFSIGYYNSEIQDGVQDCRRNLKSPYYHW